MSALASTALFAVGVLAGCGPGRPSEATDQRAVALTAPGGAGGTGAGGANAGNTLTLIATAVAASTANTTSAVVTVPAGVQPGDFAVVLVVTSGTVGLASSPSGFTTANLAASNHRLSTGLVGPATSLKWTISAPATTGATAYFFRGQQIAVRTVSTASTTSSSFNLRASTPTLGGASLGYALAGLQLAVSNTPTVAAGPGGAWVGPSTDGKQLYTWSQSLGASTTGSFAFPAAAGTLSASSTFRSAALLVYAPTAPSGTGGGPGAVAGSGGAGGVVGTGGVAGATSRGGSSGQTANPSPHIDSATVAPQTALVGDAISLSSAGSDPVAGPSPLSYYWSTTGGVIDNPIGPSATLTSATPGTFTITLTVSDGAAIDTATRTVTFVAPPTGGAGGTGGGAPSNPNILLIIADDLGAEATGLYPDLAGARGQAPIPNIAALASNGLVFNNAWASPVCSPTRGTIVSGQYGFRTGVTNVGNVLPTSAVTLFDRLNAESPYTHAFFGKFHLGGGSVDVSPPTVVTDANTILQHVRDLGITNFRGILGGGLTDYFNWWTFDTNGAAVANTTYATTALADFAIDFIHQRKAANPNQPWFLYQAFNAPHAAKGGNNPFQVPPPELHHVDLSSVGNPAAGVSQTNIPVYQADIQALDTEIGRLLREVDFSTTLVIFVGDNGVPPPVKDTASGLRDAKGSAHEGGVRVPLVFAGAGVTRQGRTDSLFVTTDLYATILDVAGVSGASHVNDGYSVKPLLSDGTASSGRTYSFSEISTGTSQRQYGLRDTRFKLVNNLGSWELFDLVADPRETTNLYTNAQYGAVRAALQVQIAALKAGAPAGYFQ